MLLVEVIVTFIFASILPHIVPVAVHHSILEASLEVAAVRPLKASIATHFIIGPKACVLGAICPEIDTFSFLDSFLEVAVIVAAI